MYRKNEILYLSSFSQFAQFTIDSLDVHAWLYDNIRRKETYELQYVATPSTLLFDNQFSVDFDKNQFFFAQNLLKNYIKVQYYSYGDMNPFYATSNISLFIEKVLARAHNNITSGIYLYQTEYDPEYIWRIENGSFTYNGEFFVYKGQTLNFKELAPPTLENYCRCYSFFINEEIVESYTNNQINTLTKLGMIKSEMYQDLGKAKLDTKIQYDNLYKTEPLIVAYVYLLIDQKTKNYEFWIEYVPNNRSKI